MHKANLESNKLLFAACGSCRAGFPNNQLMRRLNARLVGVGWTRDNYDLFAYGKTHFNYISLAHQDNAKPVKVEVHSISEHALHSLDIFHGHKPDPESPDDNFYQRSLISIIINGKELECWMYHIDQNDLGLPILSGDWTDHKAPKSNSNTMI